MLRGWIVGSLCLAALAASVGCRSPYAGDRLAGAGAVVGGVTGAALARQNPLAGALIGATVGGVTGAVVGDSIDEAEARNQALIQERIGRQMTGTVTYQDVVTMTRAGLGDSVICTHIKNHGMSNPPTADDLIQLKQQGVSDAVLTAIQQPPPRPVNVVRGGPPVIVEERVYGPPPYWYHHRHHCEPRYSWGIEYHSR